MSARIFIFEIGRRAMKSARGLAHSKTLARGRCALNVAKRLGVWQSSAALVVALACLVTDATAMTNNFFAQGIELNRAGKFPEAAVAFQFELKNHLSSGALLNLGVSEWQGGHAGAAILAWEQARWLDTFDVRAEANLKFARQVAQVDAPELRWFEMASTWLPPNVWVWLAGASLWLAVGALVLPRVFRWKKSGGPQALASLGFCLFIFAMTANVGVVSRTNLGFVLKKNSPLLLTPTAGSELLSTLSSGEPVRRLKSRGNYFFIRTPMATGWVERGQVGFINE